MIYSNPKEEETKIKLELFEEAMCCETGICGLSFDPELVIIAKIMTQLKESPEVEVGATT